MQPPAVKEILDSLSVKSANDDAVSHAISSLQCFCNSNGRGHIESSFKSLLEDMFIDFRERRRERQTDQH